MYSLLSRFEELYNNSPAVLRKAKLFSQRVEEGDRYVTKQFTKVIFVFLRLACDWVGGS